MRPTCSTRERDGWDFPMFHSTAVEFPPSLLLLLLFVEEPPFSGGSEEGEEGEEGEVGLCWRSREAKLSAEEKEKVEVKRRRRRSSARKRGRILWWVDPGEKFEGGLLSEEGLG